MNHFLGYWCRLHPRQVSICKAGVLLCLALLLLAAGAGAEGPPAASLCLDDPFDDPQLASDWQLAGIGDATTVDASTQDGKLWLSGDGSSLFTDDHGAFLSRPVEGDFRAEVLLSELPVDAGGALRKAGLMLRLPTDGSFGRRDRRLMLTYMPEHPAGPSLQFGARDVLGEPGYELAGSVNVTLPLYLAVERRGDTWTAYYRTPGGPWLQPQSAGEPAVLTLVADEIVEVGPVVSSYAPSQPLTAAIEQMSVCRPNPFRATAAAASCVAQPVDLLLMIRNGEVSARHAGTFAGSRMCPDGRFQ